MCIEQILSRITDYGWDYVGGGGVRIDEEGARGQVGDGIMLKRLQCNHGLGVFVFLDAGQRTQELELLLWSS